MKTSIGLLLVYLSPTSAQFHLTNALNLQASALVQEEMAKEAEAEAAASAMDNAVAAMEEAEKEREYQEALEKGEPYAPDGTPIPENQNNGIRALDPRTPTTFGDPFARANNVEEEVSDAIMDAGLSDEELAMLAALEAGELNMTDFTFDDVHNTMIYVSVPPRNMCGVSLNHASDICGPTCDESMPFCVMGHVSGVDDFPNFFDQETQSYDNWGKCFPEVTCDDLDQHELITNSTDECQTRHFENPCPHPCDCYRSESKKTRCHETCARTDSIGIVMCSIKRKAGLRRREMKIARELGLAQACDFNVYYEHPLMNAEALMTESLPGLFGTF